MIIRNDQMASLQRAHLRNFESRALAFLARQYPQEFSRQGNEGMLQLLRDTMKWTKAFGMNTEAGVVVCTELSIRYGRNFQTRETWAGYILNHPELDIQAKVRRLNGYALR